MSPRLDDTIVAVSSPPGRSPRGLVRLSGPQVRGILSHLISCKVEQRARRLLPCSLDLPPRIPALGALHVGPRTYTAQDIAELHVPGNPALLDRVIHRAVQLGARLAEPGEFTFRAYVAGKLDLTQAEGVAATIAAVSDSQLDAARLLQQGDLGRFATKLVDDLATQLALVEAGIDFTDQEDVVPISPGKLQDNLTTLIDRLDHMLAHSRSWGVIESLPRVVFVGAPSTGKSTLFNALLGRPRAVISPTPGTTRDVLIEPLTLPGGASHSAPCELLLVDIPGLDDPRSALDRQVQQSAREAIERADLVLRIDDGQTHAATSPVSLPPRVPGLHVRTKADLPAQAVPRANDTAGLSVSAVTGAGLDDLRRRIIDRLGDRAVSVSADLLTLQPRHESALRDAREHFREAVTLLSPQHERHTIDHAELIAGALRSVLDALASLGGQMTPDDVIGRVFATFCVGK